MVPQGIALGEKGGLLGCVILRYETVMRFELLKKKPEHDLPLKAAAQPQ
jgi:hypothetical protein